MTDDNYQSATSSSQIGSTDEARQLAGPPHERVQIQRTPSGVWAVYADGNFIDAYPGIEAAHLAAREVAAVLTGDGDR